MNKNLPFTHPSYANENNLDEDNQRLEFLGDSLLGFIVSNFLYENFEDKDEGFLSHFKSQLVSTETISNFAKKLEIDKKLLLSSGEEKNKGRENQKILADSFEAYLAYIFLKKGLKKAKKLVEELLKEEIEIKKEKLEKLDSKSNLQQICQKKGLPIPEYKINCQEGPPHKPVFKIDVFIEGKYFGSGIGASKKEAEQKAAEEALKKLKE